MCDCEWKYEIYIETEGNLGQSVIWDIFPDFDVTKYLIGEYFHSKEAIMFVRIGYNVAASSW